VDKRGSLDHARHGRITADLTNGSQSAQPYRRDFLADFHAVLTGPPLGRRAWRNRPSQLGLAPPLYNPAALSSLIHLDESPSEP
jgi:hypothetical protein